MIRTAIKKNDILLLLSVLLAAAGLYLYMKASAAAGADVRVLSNGRLLGQYPLSQDRVLTITQDRVMEGEPGTDIEGPVNVLVIKDGGCFMEQADCPDGICVRRGRISLRGESIICLPHRLVIEISGGDEQEVDTIAR
jgi:hypothetical protein